MRTPNRHLFLLPIVASLLAFATTSRAETFVLQVPISGDVVAVTLEIVDAPGGGGVDFDVSVPSGEGDLLGLFGNVVDESLVGQLSVDNPTGILTQWQFKKNKVWKVGGGNVMAPVKKWDWGLRIGQNGSAGGAVEQASFGLRAPGLDVAQVLNAVNQGWVFGVRVQGTSGSEGSSKMGLPDGQPPVGNAPTVTIDQPPDGSITNQTPATIVGTVTGSPEPTVDVNGQAAVVTGESFTFDLALAEGSNTVTATAANSQGTASDTITVVLDTIVPLVTINVPADGATTSQTDVLVEGTVADASPIASFQILGVDVPLTAGAFSTTVTIPTDQATAIDAVAVDAAGNVGSATVTVTHGTAPTIAITGPANATRTAGNAVLVTGTVSGSGDPAVDVNGTPVTVAGGSFSLNLPLALGDNRAVDGHAHVVVRRGLEVARSLEPDPERRLAGSDVARLERERLRLAAHDERPQPDIGRVHEPGLVDRALFALDTLRINRCSGPARRCAGLGHGHPIGAGRELVHELPAVRVRARAVADEQKP